MNLEYIAVVINSTIRMTTPVLYAALGSSICSRAKVFNVALEGQMLLGAFIAILVNHYTANITLSVLAAAAAGIAVSCLVAALQVKLEASDMVVGTATNLLVLALTTFLLYVIFHTKGAYTNPAMRGLPKINLPFIKNLPFLGAMLAQLTFLDYLAFIIAGILYLFLFKTVPGFHVLAVGVNKGAVISQGAHADRIQILVVLLSGLLCGLGGVLLTLGQVTLYTENITAGRGFIAMAAGSLGRNHPIGVIISSCFFGAAQALGNVLQGTAIKSQLTMALPYLVTVLALVFTGGKLRGRKKG
jgi:simple sugar transport system permease protein